MPLFSLGLFPLEFVDCRLWVVGCGLCIVGCRLWVVGCGLWVVGDGLWVVGERPPPQEWRRTTALWREAVPTVVASPKVLPVLPQSAENGKIWGAAAENSSR